MRDRSCAPSGRNRNRDGEASVSDAATPLWALFGVRFLALYAALGCFAALAFQLRGMRAVDPNTQGSTWGFRVLVTPGLIALWPLMLWAWRRGHLPAERNAHRAQEAQS